MLWNSSEEFGEFSDKISKSHSNTKDWNGVSKLWVCGREVSHLLKSILPHHRRCKICLGRVMHIENWKSPLMLVVDREIHCLWQRKEDRLFWNKCLPPTAHCNNLQRVYKAPREAAGGRAFRDPAPVFHSLWETLLYHWGVSPQLYSGHMSQQAQGFWNKHLNMKKGFGEKNKN